MTVRVHVHVLAHVLALWVVALQLAACGDDDSGGFRSITPPPTASGTFGSASDDVWIVGHQLGDGGAKALIYHRGPE